MFYVTEEAKRAVLGRGKTQNGAIKSAARNAKKRRRAHANSVEKIEELIRDGMLQLERQ